MGNPRAQRVGDVLVNAQVIDALQLRSALAQHDAWGGRLANVVVEMGLAEEETVVDCLARSLGVQRVRVGNLPRDPQALAKLDVAFAEERGLFPVALRDGGKVLLLAMADPSDIETLDEVTRRARVRVSPFIAGEREIRAAIARHYRGGAPGPTEGRRTSSRQSNPVAPVTRPLAEDEEEEFKLVDMAGNTVMKPLAEILGDALGGQIPAPAQTSNAQPSGSASALLDDMLGEGARHRFSDEDLQRLRTVQLNQEKTARIVRAVMELLLEKGALSRAALQEKLRG